jgi:hypothetical protein
MMQLTTPAAVNALCRQRIPLAPSIRYRWTVLVMLTLVYTFNFIDRQILVILQEPIKADLGLSDAQLGLLSGFSFALVYVTAGIPIAWLADRGNRRNIVAVSLGFWSFMTALSGLAQNYGQLLAARIGVGIGEAGGSPPSHSMVSDYFPRQATRHRPLVLQHRHLHWHFDRLCRRRLDRRDLRLASRFFSRRRTGYFLRPALGLGGEGAKAGTVGSGRGTGKINL